MKHRELIARRNALENQYWQEGLFVKAAWDDLIAEFYEHGYLSGAALAERKRDFFVREDVK